MIFVWLMIIAGSVVLDQLTKWLTVINLDLGETVPVIEGFFNFKYVRNEGAAFGAFSEPDQRWIFMSISTIAIVLLSIYLWKNRDGSKLLCVALSFIVGGGIGNMIDRICLGYVTDFLDFIIWYTPDGWPIHFATFNIADTFVCVGVGLFALQVILEEIENAKRDKAAKLAAAAVCEEVEEDAENTDHID